MLSVEAVHVVDTSVVVVVVIVVPVMEVSLAVDAVEVSDVSVDVVTLVVPDVTVREVPVRLPVKVREVLVVNVMDTVPVAVVLDDVVWLDMLLVTLWLEVVARRYQTVGMSLPTQVILSCEMFTASNPIIVITLFVEIIGYLNLPSKLAKPSWTFTNCPSVFLQNPSKSRVRKITNSVTGGRTCVLTVALPALMFPVVAAVMPGTVIAKLTTVALSEVELLIALCVWFRFNTDCNNNGTTKLK
jgi:hypothetical protein